MKILKKLMIFFLLAIFCFAAFSCSPIDNSTLEQSYEEQYTRSRDAKNSDLTNVDFVYANDYRSVSIRFVPKNDIEGLKVQAKLSTSTGFLLDSQIITVGDVIEGQQYVVNSILPDNSITEGKVIKTCEFSVYSGTVYYSVAPGIYLN